MIQVKSGDTVQVHYKGTLKDGTLFDSSEGRDPLQFEVGKGMVIKGFDDALLGMSIGDKKTVDIPVEQAYGQANPEMVMEFSKSDFPADMTPEAGMQIHLSDNMGNNFPALIKEVKDETVVIDANHALAGKDLIFEIELVAIS